MTNMYISHSIETHTHTHRKQFKMPRELEVKLVTLCTKAVSINSSSINSHQQIYTFTQQTEIFVLLSHLNGGKTKNKNKNQTIIPRVPIGVTFE